MYQLFQDRQLLDYRKVLYLNQYRLMMQVDRMKLKNYLNMVYIEELHQEVYRDFEYVEDRFDKDLNLNDFYMFHRYIVSVQNRIRKHVL